LSAQEFRGTLMGRVTDPSGAGVPSAKIVIVKTNTNTRSETVSSQDGNYTMPFLAPGSYEVAVEVKASKSIRTRESRSAPTSASARILDWKSGVRANRSP
jgi:hypothetical protein